MSIIDNGRKRCQHIYILAGLVAACLAWWLNRRFYARFGSYAVGTLVPVTEELLKTGLACLYNTSIAATHGVFGAIELIWDFSNPGKGHWLPALLGFLSHLFYGFFTQWVSVQAKSLFGGILAATLLHMAWNRLMMRLDNE